MACWSCERRGLGRSRRKPSPPSSHAQTRTNNIKYKHNASSRPCSFLCRADPTSHSNKTWAFWHHRPIKSLVGQKRSRSTLALFSHLLLLLFFFLFLSRSLFLFPCALPCLFLTDTTLQQNVRAFHCLQSSAFLSAKGDRAHSSVPFAPHPLLFLFLFLRLWLLSGSSAFLCSLPDTKHPPAVCSFHRRTLTSLLAKRDRDRSCAPAPQQDHECRGEE